MKKIKVLRIITRLNIGGPAIHTILLTEGLDKNRFGFLFVCGSIDKSEGDMLYYSLQKNIRPIFIPELKRELNFLNDIIAFKKIYDIIKIERPDIIHTHTAKAGTLGRLSGILYNFLHRQKPRRIKLIHTFHGHIFEGYFGRFKTKLFILIERILAFFTCKIISVSESLKKELISLKIAKEDKIAVIRLGLELDNFLKILSEDNHRDDSVLNIGIVGRLVPIKNHRLFLEVAAKVISDNPKRQLKFQIIGDGELKEELHEYARKLGIDKQVNFLGWQKDLMSIYSSLDIVALTSINEGTPVSLIEAMASGKPVVATDAGGVRDLLGKEADIGIMPNANFKLLERGIIVQPHDSFGFAKALHLLLENNELRQSIGVAARSFVATEFRKERLIKDIEDLYNRIYNRIIV